MRIVGTIRNWWAEMPFYRRNKILSASEIAMQSILNSFIEAKGWIDQD